MSIAQARADISPSGEARCPHCHAVLPTQAQFCASCGERIQRQNYLEDDTNIVARYRKTSLLHRRPFVSLFFATDSRQRRQVVLRDIDVSSLSEDDRANAYTTLQQEYDLLRQRTIATLMPAIDMGYFQGHLFTVAGWSVATNATEDEIRLHTLQDVLQSGNALPSIFVALSWIEQLCRALAVLHEQNIVIGDLDPHTLLFDRNDSTDTLAVMISWLPISLYKLFPHIPSMNGPTHFAAPEVLLGHPEPRSDIYSLGAILYLLLTGSPPEEPAQRIQHRLRPPSELNSHINSSLDALILQALALDSPSRFESANAMLEALTRLQKGTSTRKSLQGKESDSNASVVAKGTQVDPEPAHELAPTISQEQVSQLPVPEPAHELAPTISQEQVSQLPVQEFTVEQPEISAPPFQDDSAWKEPDPARNMLVSSSTPSKEDEAESNLHAANSMPTEQPLSFKDTFKNRLSGLLPAIPSSLHRRSDSPTASSLSEQPTNRALVPVTQARGNAGNSPRNLPGFLKHIQHAFLGEQKRDITAAAVIETPLRIQPEQAYAIRIKLMGRNKQQEVTAKNASDGGSNTGGISAFTEGDIIHIEVRSVLYQNYAYVVQQANVTIPAEGYAAEVTIPMQPLSNGPSGRRDRLHIFFMDSARHPLYEKPFVLEIFISHLVQPGREGHNVLTIPL
jgi:serine/threonine protein kinase